MMRDEQSKCDLCGSTLFGDQSYQFDKLIEKQLCPMIHEGNVKFWGWVRLCSYLETCRCVYIKKKAKEIYNWSSL